MDSTLRDQPGKDNPCLTVVAAWLIYMVEALPQRLARRAQQLRREANALEKTIGEVVESWRPEILKLDGVGPIVAAVVLCAWSHPGRVRSEAAFAMLAGVAPIPASLYIGRSERPRKTLSGQRAPAA